jgi:hypothetical protein
MRSPDREQAPAGGGPREPRPDAPDHGDRPAVPPLRIDPKMIALLIVGMVAALLIFWFEPSFTLRYAVCGILGAVYVFLRFNDWR